MNIDLVSESESHVLLRKSLHSFLFQNQGKKPPVCRHYDCSLGKWLYSEGLFKYKNISEIHLLERIHAEFHEKIANLQEAGKGSKERLYVLFTEVEAISEKLVSVTEVLNKKIKTNSAAEDISENISLCDQAEKLGEALTEMNTELMREHETLLDFFMQAPGLFCVLKGPSHIFQLINPYYKQMIGDRELKGLDIRTAMPELKGQGVYELLDKVYERKKIFTGIEIPVYFNKDGIQERAFVNFIYKPIVNRKDQTTGILVFGYDVSEQVNLRIRSEESETRLKLAIDAAEVGSFEWNMNTKEFIYSDRIASIFGYDQGVRISHKSFTDCIHMDDKSIRMDAMEKALSTGILCYEARIVRPDGQLRWIKFSGRIIFDKKNNPLKMYGTALDITVQKTIEERLERKVRERTKELMYNNELLSKEKELANSVINSSIDNIIVLDTRLRFVITNDNALKGYKKKQEDLIGSQIHKVFPEIKKSGLYNELRRALKGEFIQNFNYRSSELKGYFETSLIPLRDNSSKVYGVLLIAHDNTSIIEASEKLISANKNLEEKNASLEKNNRELEAFRYIANHDLQEPLRKIQIFSGLINKSINNTSLIKEYSELIRSSSRSMADLIQAVLDYSKLSNKNTHNARVDLNKVLEHAIDRLQPIIDEKKGKIRGDRLHVIKGSESQLNHLFCCLISNGLKFCDKRPVITITSKIISRDIVIYKQKKHKYLELIFRDNGIGFEPEYYEQVFKMFKRLQNSKAYPGAGIGLAMVKKIIDNHNGQIFIKSNPGKGTSFYLYLPLA